jgi:ABC-2 type transport system permease protein
MEINAEKRCRGRGIIGVQTVAGLLRLYVYHMKMGISSAMIYRADFITGVFVSIFVSGIGPFVQFLYFTHSRGYPEWTLNQILLFQGLLLLWFGLRDLLFGQVRNTVMDMVWKGDFDRLLLKPYPTVGLLLCSGFQLHGIGSCIAGVLVTVLAFHRLDVSINLWTVPLLIVALICGVVLFMAITIFYCSIVIMLIQISRISELFDRITDFANYPVNIYPLALRVVMIVFLPFAVWTYYPTQILLDRLDYGIWFALAGCVGVFYLSIKVWYLCLKMYTSAGG